MDDVIQTWSGTHASADDALAALNNQIEREARDAPHVSDMVVLNTAAITVRELELETRLSIVAARFADSRWCVGFTDTQSGRVSVCIYWSVDDPSANVDRFKAKIRRYLADRDAHGTQVCISP